MPYRTIVVSLNDVSNADVLIAASMDLALRQDAHIIGLYVIPSPMIYPEVGFAPVSTVDDHRTQYFKSNLEPLREKFESALRKNAVKGGWRTVKSSHEQLTPDIRRIGSRADLIIASQIPRDDSMETDSDLAERLVMESGRPILVLPQNAAWKAPDSAVVGFNGRREAVHAVFDSIPLLQRMRNVYVTWVNPYKERSMSGDVPCAEITVALVRHGIKATADSISALDSNAGEALLQKASDVGAGLLVMGAYGHSRMREYVFGGSTRHVLQNAKLPVLMSH